MRRADIQYQCDKYAGQTVTCRIISKHLFGFLLREQHAERRDFGYPPVKMYGYIWSWKVIEKW